MNAMTEKDKPFVSYEDDLFKRLQDKKFAAGYIQACAEEGQAALLVALRDVVKARRGIAAVAEEIGRDRSQLYKTLSEEGNPRLDGLLAVLDSLDLKIAIEPKRVA